MARFCILSALKSEMSSCGEMASQCEGKVVLVFNAENMRNTSVHGCVIMFRCSRFVIDEDKSVGNWKTAFGYNTEGNDMVIITINPDYKVSVVMPYFG
jgi:hypothetical protein